MVGEVSRKLGITEQSYYRWRREYGGLRVDQDRRLKELEKENGRLKRMLADLTLDNAILKEGARETSEPSRRRKVVRWVCESLRISNGGHAGC